MCTRRWLLALLLAFATASVGCLAVPVAPAHQIAGPAPPPARDRHGDPGRDPGDDPSRDPGGAPGDDDALADPCADPDALDGLDDPCYVDVPPAEVRRALAAERGPAR